MSSEWRVGKLGDFIELKRGYDLPQAKRVSGSVPLVSSSGVSDWHDKAMVKGPGVVTGRYGTIGQVYFVEEDYWPLNTTLYVRDFKGNDPKFINYFLKTVDFFAFSDKAAVPGVNRNHLHEAIAVVPALRTQKNIAELLGSLDDRIALLRETNATLEAIAQALFKSWFVDFDPVRAKQDGRTTECMDQATAALFPNSFEESELGLVPKGWRVASLDAIANFLNGLALQKFPPENEDDWLPVIKIAQLRKGDTAGSDRASPNIKQEYTVQNGDVLFSWSGSLEVEIWCGGAGALNQHLFKVSSADFPKWFYFFWTRQHLPHFQQIAASKATTMGHIQRKHLTEAKVVVPSEAVMASACDVFEPLLERLINNALQAKTLATLRDTLLPRLISGQLRLPEAEAEIEGVTA